MNYVEKYALNKQLYRDLVLAISLEHSVFADIQIGGRSTANVTTDTVIGTRISDYDKQYTVESLDKEEGFPYSKNFMPDAQTMMNNLRNAKFDVIDDGPNRIVLKRHFPRDHILSDSTSNHFTEVIRMSCQFNKYATPRDTWKKIKSDVKLRLNSGDKMTYREVFELIYNDSNTRICNTFNEAYCTWMIKTAAERMNIDLSKIRMLDPSSGWGNRLIAAYACKIQKYRGYDPNPKLTPLYKDIMKEFGGKTKAVIAEAPFEESNQKSGSYDIVLTSPPYFAYEVYDDGQGQSVSKYPDYDEWVINMYRPYLTKAYTYLKVGGTMIVYIEDIFIDNQKYPLSSLTDDIMHELGAQDDLEYGLNVVFDQNVARFKGKPKKRHRARYAKSWVKTERVADTMAKRSLSRSSRIELMSEDEEREHQIELGNLADIGVAARKSIESIMRDSRVMRTVGNGKIWNDKKIDKFFEYAKSDVKEDPLKRDSFYYGVVYDGQYIGVVGIHKVWGYSVKTKDKFFVTIFIDYDYHGRGIGREIIRMAVDEFRKLRGDDVYAHVDKDNIASAKSLEKAGFARDEEIDDKVGDRVLIGYSHKSQKGGDSEPMISDSDNDNGRDDGNDNSGNKESITVNAKIEWLDQNIISDIWESRAADGGYEIKWEDVRHSDVLLLDGKYMYDKKYYDYTADLKGRLEATGLTDKIKLHTYLVDRQSPHIPETYVVTSDTDETKRYADGPWIWRPEGGFGGRGISYVEDEKSAIELIGSLGKKKALLSRVISKPMLYFTDEKSPNSGYKFHFRMFMIVYKTQERLEGYMVNEGEIFTAKEPYVDVDYQNKDIHDSHHGSTVGHPRFPRDYNKLGYNKDRLTMRDAGLVMDSIQDILTDVLSVKEIADTIQVYPEANAGMEILGCDFMMDFSGKVYLIEVNSKVSLNRTEETRKWLNTLLGNALYETVIGPRYFGHNRLEVTRTLVQHQHQHVGGSDSKTVIPKTYMSNIDQLDHQMFDQMMTKRGWQKVKYDSNKSTKPGLIMLTGFGSYDKKFWDYPSHIKSRIQATEISNKVNLHQHLMNADSNAIPTSYVVTDKFEFPSDGGSWIFRPEKGMMGRGVKVVTNQSEFDDIWRLHKQQFPKEKAVLSKYIDNPKLITVDGTKYKFHLRMYLLVTLTDKKRAYLYRDGRLFHAKNEYTDSDYDSSDIHDTHLKSSTPDLKFRTNYPGNTKSTDAAFDKIRQMMSDVMSITIDKLEPYPENDYGFEIFGIDVMFDADDNDSPYLLEINSAPGLGDNPHMVEYLSKMLFGGIEETILAEVDGEPIGNQDVAEL